MERGPADIGAPVFVGEGGGFQKREAAVADLLQARAVGAAGGGVVKIDRHAVAPPVLLAGGPGQSGALLQSDAAQGHEGDHVGRADTRMDAGVAGHVDQPRGDAGRGDSGCEDCVGGTGEGQHGTVVIGVDLQIQKQNAGHGGSGAGDGGDDAGLAPFTEIRNAFDQAAG